MRKITKYAQPDELRDWRRRAKKAGVNYSFDGMRGDVTVKQTVMHALLREQYSLCAYTGIRIAETTCHFEHLKAQDYCTADEATEYRNLVACYPNTGKCEFGAFRKDNWPDHHDPAQVRLFVSPLVKQCELSFEYEDTGRINVKAGLTATQTAAARATIDELNLDDKELSELRRRAIVGTLRPRQHLLSAQETQTILAKIDRPKDGELRPFSFVIKQALERHLASLTI